MGWARLARAGPWAGPGLIFSLIVKRIGPRSMHASKSFLAWPSIFITRSIYILQMVWAWASLPGMWAHYHAGFLNKLGLLDKLHLGPRDRAMSDNGHLL